MTNSIPMFNQTSQEPVADPLPWSTESLCPVCLKRLPALIRRSGQEILLCRLCPDHGLFEEPIWRGSPDIELWRRPKKPAVDVKLHLDKDKGCPYDCGLCPEHGQHPCTVLMEVTHRCDLLCPVCYASSGVNPPLAESLESLIQYLKYIKTQAGQVVLQISGGEPTLYDDLVELVAQAAQLFPAVQLNTNGLKIASRPDLAKELSKAGLKWVFLQFDSLKDEVYQAIRGRPLVDLKLSVVEILKQAGLPTVLVPTVVKGLNDSELGDLVRYGLKQPMVRGLHFQPMTSTGRTPFKGADSRLTLPELLVALGEQTDGEVDPNSAFPPGCEHERCSFHLRFHRTKDGRLKPAPGAQAVSDGCCGRPPKTTSEASQPAETTEARNRAVDIILKSWSQPKQNASIPMLERKPDAFDEFIAQASQASFSLTAMAFQDVWTVDLNRLRGCCVHVFSPPNRFIPFCAMNLTSTAGRALYRSNTGG
jgi:uncharacterized radical SAM superfamily Fe-S cluster-containing enzyme